MVKTSSPMVAADSTRPGMSAATASGFFDPGHAHHDQHDGERRHRGHGHEDAAQLKCSSSQPPTIGPSAIATPAMASHRPIARARSRLAVKMFEIRESVAGKVMAAPSPMTARAAIELRRTGGEPACQAGRAEHGQPGQQHPLPAEPVRQAAEDQQQRGEHQVVGVDHPLQLGGGGMQLAHQARAAPRSRSWYPLCSELDLTRALVRRRRSP